MKKIKIVILNYYLYTLLLIITPFLMLQNYLQQAIGDASRSGVDIGFISIPYVVIIAFLIIILFFYLSRKILSKRRFLFLGFIIVFFAIGQLTSDYYFNHHFYDLQHNWHYFAYGIFAYIAYRRFSLKSKPLYKILFKIFYMALLISVFDEFIQIHISSRVFDLSDVAKDLWGNMIGIIFICFYLDDGKGLPNFKFRQKRIKEYMTNPFSLICLEIIFAYIFLFVSSQITDVKYTNSVIFITLLAFLFFFILLYLGQNIIVRWVIRGVVIIFISFVLFAVYFSSPHIKYIKPGHINYNGIPLIYFDYMIFPSGVFRTVDKKESFGYRDKQKIENMNFDILLIGTGNKNEGGKGWDDLKITEMVYSPFSKGVYQIIKLPNQQACHTYNRLSKQGKKTLFIIHNQ